MPIYKFEFPIENYECNGIFMQDLYIESETFPNEEQIKNLLQKLEKESIEASEDYCYPYFNCWQQCLDCFDYFEPEFVGSMKSNNRKVKMPYLYSNIVFTNERVCHPKYGDQSWSVSIIEPYKL